VTSDNGRDPHIVYLHGQGRSIRSIAREVGLSRSQVHRILAADADDDDARLALMDVDDADPDDPEGDRVDPPLVFVGIDFEGFPRGVERVLDAAGRHVDGLRLYRWRQHHDGDGHDAELEAAEADLARQIAAQGLGAGANRGRLLALAADSSRVRMDAPGRPRSRKTGAELRTAGARCARCVHAIERILQKQPLSCMNSGARYWD
jgi:hypothetical protein